MRYIKDDVLKNWHDKEVMLKEDNGEDKAMTIVRVLQLVAGGWSPAIQEAVLPIMEIRHLQEALKTLEEDPDEDGFYAFEDTHFAVLEKVVKILITRIPPMAMQAPQVEDMLNRALKEKPKTQEHEVSAPSPNGAKESETKTVNERA